MNMAMFAEIVSDERLKGKVTGIGMLREYSPIEFSLHISFLRMADRKLLKTYVSVPMREMDQLVDPEAELMEIVQLAIYEALVNG